jgi:tetratricopeptide (TPR) repeat protein
MFGRSLLKALVGEWMPAPARSGSPGAPGTATQEDSGNTAWLPLTGTLARVAILGAILIMGSGCSSSRGTAGPSDSQKESFFSQIRPASGDTARLLRNAHYYRIMGRPELALKELEEAHQLAPDNLKIVNTLASCYEELGEFPRAQKLYQEALSRQGANAALHNNLCFSYYQAGRWQEAEACFREALAADPANVAARNNLGLLYCRLGKPDEARRLWQEAEGSAAAEQKVNLALAALGMSAPPVYAQSPGTRQQQTVVKAPATAGPAPQSSQVQSMASQREIPATPKKIPAQNPGRAATPPPAGAAPAPAAAKAQKSREHASEITPNAAAPKPVASARPQPPVRPGPLTAAELVETAIEVRNGTRTQNLARHTRTALSQKGFNVTLIGNHLDFGAERTTIYYRPGAERVARNLGSTCFPTAGMAESARLRNGVDVKILLGHDLLQRDDLMARLADGEANR